jgi:hypothetical protein
MAGKILKIVETFDEIGSLINISPPQPKNTKLYYTLGSVINPDTYSPKFISDLLGSNYLRLQPNMYDELMNIFEEYDKHIDENLRLYTIRNNNKQEFDIFNTESNKSKIYSYLTNLLEYISSKPNPDVTVFYEDLNRRIANQINKHINPYYGVTLLSLGPETIEDIIPPFIIDAIPGKYRYNIVVIGDESTQKDIIKSIKTLKKNKETEGYFNIILFTGKVYLPSLSESVNTRIDFVDSFISNLSTASQHMMYWGKYACGDITNYITDARRISQKGYTVYNKHILVKNSYVCVVNTDTILIDPRDMYTYEKFKLYTSLITFTKHFIESLTIVLNYAQQDTVLNDWKNSLDYDITKVDNYGKQFKIEHTHEKLSESVNINNTNNMNNENEEHVYSFESILNNVDSSINNTLSSKSSSDNIMEDSDTGSSHTGSSHTDSHTRSNSAQSGGYLMNKLKEYRHKYDKYKYKHEILRKRVISVLRRDGHKDLLDEILKYN